MATWCAASPSYSRWPSAPHSNYTSKNPHNRNGSFDVNARFTSHPPAPHPLRLPNGTPSNIYGAQVENQVINLVHTRPRRAQTGPDPEVEQRIAAHGFGLRLRDVLNEHEGGGHTTEGNKKLQQCASFFFCWNNVRLRKVSPLFFSIFECVRLFCVPSRTLLKLTFDTRSGRFCESTNKENVLSDCQPLNRPRERRDTILLLLLLLQQTSPQR